MALRSLPCHMGSSYLARLTRNSTQDLSKRGSPQGMQAKGTVLGPHTNTPAPTARGWRMAPSQVGGNRDQTAPPQARQTEQGAGAGHAQGHGPRGTALPAPSAGTGEVRKPHHPGRGERTPLERKRTHKQRARGDYQKGNRTELAERTDRVEWRTSERG